MTKTKIIETFSSNSNGDYSEWYSSKVINAAKFFVKHVKPEEQFMDPGYLLSINSRMTSRDKELIST